MPKAREPTVGIICKRQIDLRAVTALFDQVSEIEVEGVAYNYGSIKAVDLVAVQESENQHAAFHALKLREHHPSLVSERSFCFLLGDTVWAWTSSQEVRPEDIVIASERLIWKNSKTSHDDVVISALHVEHPSQNVHAYVSSFLEDADRFEDTLAKEFRHIAKGMHGVTNSASTTPMLNLSKPSAVAKQGSQHSQRRNGVEIRPRIHHGQVVASLTAVEAEQISNLLEDNKILVVDEQASAILAEMNNVVVIRSMSLDEHSKQRTPLSNDNAAIVASCARFMISSLNGSLPKLYSPKLSPSPLTKTQSNTHSVARTSDFNIDLVNRRADEVIVLDHESSNSGGYPPSPRHLDPSWASQNSATCHKDQNSRVSSLSDHGSLVWSGKISTAATKILPAPHIEEVNQAGGSIQRISGPEHDIETPQNFVDQIEQIQPHEPYMHPGGDGSAEDEPVPEPMTRVDSLAPAVINQTECPDDWTTIFHARAKELQLTLTDAGDHGSKVSETWNATQIMLSASKHSRIDFARWKLVIGGAVSRQQRYREFWLPLTRVRCSKTASSATIHFSDCKHILDLGTTNAIQEYAAVYDPGHPNVVIQFDFDTDDDAVRFEDCLLHRTAVMLPDTRLIRHELPDCTLLTIPVLRARGEELTGMLTEVEKTSAGGYWYTDVELFGFSHKVDFELSLGRQDSDIRFHYIHKFIYTPLEVDKCVYWPPPEINDNADGHPDSTRFGGGSSPNSSVRLHTTNETILSLLNLTLGVVTQWTVEEYFLIDFNLRCPKRFEPLRRSTKPRKGQLTIWINNGSIRLLVRAENRDNDTPVDWTSCTIDPSSTRDLPELQISDDHGITIEKADFETGLYLSTDNFQPDAPEREKTKAISLQIQFLSGVDLDRFLRQVDGIYGNLIRNRRDSD